jgi:hypothetical protein
MTAPTDRQIWKGNLFALKTPPIPMKSFTDDSEAKEWLKKYL